MSGQVYAVVRYDSGREHIEGIYDTPDEAWDAIHVRRSPSGKKNLWGDTTSSESSVSMVPINVPVGVRARNVSIKRAPTPKAKIVVGELRHVIREELQWNYWLRRPRNSLTSDVGDEIESWREDAFDAAADDLKQRVRQLRHSVEGAGSRAEMLQIIRAFGFEPDDLLHDASMLAQANAGAFRDQLLSGIDRWEHDALEQGEQTNFSTNTMAQRVIDRPLRTVGSGGFSLKRPIGP